MAKHCPSMNVTKKQWRWTLQSMARCDSGEKTMAIASAMPRLLRPNLRWPDQGQSLWPGRTSDCPRPGNRRLATAGRPLGGSRRRAEPQPSQARHHWLQAADGLSRIHGRRRCTARRICWRLCHHWLVAADGLSRSHHGSRRCRGRRICRRFCRWRVREAVIVVRHRVERSQQPSLARK